ncbi:MAG: hypothetical protein K9G57_02675 [Ignavibacteriales bacterium]|nr:hypothetical protein [Ignavibacteriales bacterium]MCF8435724.1 hypothetical protein [Ignavibacteriales bacterium]
MKIYLKIIALLIFGFSGISNAQIYYDEFGNIDLKRLSEEDAKRIYGDMYAPKMFVINGEQKLIKESIINGNKVTTLIFNYGSICEPNRLGGVADLVWNGLGYGFEFGPLAAAEVVNDSGKVYQIVSDSFIRSSPLQGDYSPDRTEKWGWLPKSGYVDPDQDEIARLNAPDENGDGKPDSWPDRWYSAGAEKYIWPAFLGDQATAPDEEVYFVVDDYSNKEFPYYPFSGDSSKRGIGLDMECRIIQFNNPLAEDIIFLVYQVTNASDKTLPEVYFGMHGDPHIGGASDYADDRAGFVNSEGFTLQSTVQFPQRARNMVYAWDTDQTGSGGKKTGYFAWKFLESPSEGNDLFDNDFDGITDESPFNPAGDLIDGVVLPLNTGITDIDKYTAIYGAPKIRYSGDEDGDWSKDRDDVGIDGIGPDSPNYPGADYGEGDGKPTQGWYLDTDGNNKYDLGEPFDEERLTNYKWAGSEPQFGLRDISESDQIGLTSFHAAVYTQSYPNVPANDPLMWEWLSAGKVDTAGQELLLKQGDNIFNFGTGPSALAPGETQRFSMCILFGNDLQDMILNAETSTRILEADYRFAQPPAKPLVSAVPGDGKVTIYWDDRSESSVDPLTGKQDFLGYKILRSRDYTFSDVVTITDGRGNPFLTNAYVNAETGERGQWHKVIPSADRAVYVGGFHPVEYQGRAIKYYVGDPADETGLVHEFVDTDVTNGVTYYYAVVAFDNGSIEEGKELPPSETQAVILRDPITGELTFDANTVGVTPNPLGLGVVNAEAGLMGVPNQVVGNSTGDVYVKVLDDLLVPDKKLYKIEFTQNTVYNVLDSTGVTDRVISNDTVFVALSKGNIIDGSVTVRDASGAIVDTAKYQVNTVSGRIRASSSGSWPKNEEFMVSYRYYPVFGSTLVDNTDGNPAFDGMKVYAQNNKLELDTINTKFNNPDVSILEFATFPPSVGTSKINYRGDWEIRWENLDTTATGDWANIGGTYKSLLNANVNTPFSVFLVNPTEVEATLRINESIPAKRGNGRWDWGESIVIQPQGEPGAVTSYEIVFRIPADSINDNPVFPKQGDIYHVKTLKPFQTGDVYVFETQSVKFKPQNALDNLSDIYVVPNPYVAFSLFEEPGRTSDKRGDRELQFRNLPPQCTIRIYTITGDLVDTIYKEDASSFARWNLLSYEGQRIAYGVYIYHVDIPGVGEKIGRFAIIK